MATAYRVLGQVSPSITTATTLYTVPSATETVVSTLLVCNRGGSTAYFRIAVRPDGETLADKHYIAYDTSVDPNASIAWTVGLTLNAGDVVTVYANTSTFSFSLFGSEIS